MAKGARLQVSLLAVALLACFFLAYSIHTNYPYSFVNPENATLVPGSSYPFPFHNDEWAHAAAGLAIAEEKKANFNPYLETSISDRELGFHLFLAGVFLILGINAVLFYQYLAPLFLAINALLLFLLVRKLTKSYWIGLFSIIFLASLKSNTNFTGNWFFTPMIFSLFMIFLFLYCFTEALDNNKHKQERKTLLLGVSAAIFIIQALVYPIAAVLSAVLAFIYTLTKKDFFRKNLKEVIFFGAICLVLVLSFIRNYFWAGSIGLTFSKFMGELVFRKGWTVLEHSYSLLSLYGVAALLLACIGAVYAVIKKKHILFIIWPSALLVNLLLFAIFKISLLMPYQRSLFYLMVGLVPLSAMGLFWSCESVFHALKKAIGNKTGNKKRKAILSMIPSLACVILLALALFFTFKDYYRIEPVEFSLQKTITPEEYDALLWLRDNEQPYQKVLAKPFLSAAVYPVSRNRIVGMMPSSLEGGAYEKVYDFFNAGCELKKMIAEEEKVDFVVSNENIDCAFAEKIYDDNGEGGIFIYRIG